MRVGFIGLGNVGAKLAMSLVRNGFELTVLDLREEAMEPFVTLGIPAGVDARSVADSSDVVITCLPSPEVSAGVLENGVLAGIGPGSTWVEMSTTSRSEVLRLGRLVEERGGEATDCPVSGGCHRAATGNVAIFSGGDRGTFDRVLPLLTSMGRQILHTGPLGTASVLKVITNYLASANLVAVAEALVTAQVTGMDLSTTYEAIRISSGNSFVHETEGQLILNGSRDINFTMDLVVKDMTLFQNLADGAGLPLELSPVLLDIFEDARARYGGAEWSTNVIRRLEEATGRSVLAPGFPAELVDAEPEVAGGEVEIAARMRD